MTVPHYIGENESHMRGIHCGWYAIEDDGDLSCWTFLQSREMRQENHTADELKPERLNIATDY